MKIVAEGIVVCTLNVCCTRSCNFRVNVLLCCTNQMLSASRLRAGKADFVVMDFQLLMPSWCVSMMRGLRDWWALFNLRMSLSISLFLLEDWKVNLFWRDESFKKSFFSCWSWTSVKPCWEFDVFRSVKFVITPVEELL